MTTFATMTPRQLRKHIARLSPRSPATARFTRAWLKKPSGQREQKDVWYSTQKEHWLGWLNDMGGPGFYGRKQPPKTAELVYNRIVNPQMLIYLAEAIGLSNAVVEAASADALKKRTMPGMCSAIRKRIPWILVAERIHWQRARS